jgi:hypothetical protein
MSFIPGTEHRMIPNMAPSAAHGKNCNRLHRRRATTEKDMKLLNQMQQGPDYAKKTYMNLAYRQNFLNQQTSSNALTEIERLKGRLYVHRDPTLNDGRALTTRIKSLESKMMQLKPQPLSGPEGLYL